MTDITKITPNGIGGWLILVLIGLVITPIRIGYLIITTYLPIFRDGGWSVLTTPGTEHYHQLWAPLIVFEIGANLVTIALALVTLWFLIKKSRRAPIFAIAWLLWIAATVSIDYFAADLIQLLQSNQIPKACAS